ncbi:MAG: S16 family serine protease [Bacilli bacterium]
MITNIYEKIKSFIKKEYKFILFFLFVVLFTNLPLPYVIESPGGAISLEDRVVIDTDNEAEGSFNMAYVTMVKGTPLTLLVGALRSDWDIVSYKEFTIGDEDYEDSVNRDKLYLHEAIANASIAAYREFYGDDEEHIRITDSKIHVVHIDEQADTTLEVNDIIKSVNDINVLNLNEIKEIIKGYMPGDEIRLKVIRDDKEVEVSAILYNVLDETEEEFEKLSAEEKAKRVKMGIMAITEYEYESDPQVKVKFEESESGSSGGLMTALEIYNRLTEDDLTDGRKIIGTGEIDIEGNVGEIGGVKYKLAGAVRKKADIFLCPMENYDEAMEVKKEHNYDIEIIGVKTLSEAIQALK